MKLFALEHFCVETYYFRKISQNVIFGPPDLKMHESASHHGLTGKAQTAQQHPRDWSPIGNAELLFRRVAEPL